MCITFLANLMTRSFMTGWRKLLTEVDKNHNTHGNYFFYLAPVPPYFGPISEHLGAAELICEKDGQWRRVVFEKPFGSDLESAKALNKQVKKYLHGKPDFPH